MGTDTKHSETMKKVGKGKYKLEDIRIPRNTLNITKKHKTNEKVEYYNTTTITQLLGMEIKINDMAEVPERVELQKRISNYGTSR